MARETMTDEQLSALSHELRLWLQERACCPGHASMVCMRALAGMALDDARDDRHKAAATLRRVVKGLAEDIARGRYMMVRTAQ